MSGDVASQQHDIHLRVEICELRRPLMDKLVAYAERIFRTCEREEGVILTLG